MSKKHTRIAIVTGATSGIGEAIARKFIAAGYGVVGNARNAEKLAALEHELGASFKAVAGDAAAPATIAQFFSAASAHFGQAADLVVANAGRGLGGSVKETDLAEFENMLKINVSGSLALMKTAAEHLLDMQKTVPSDLKPTADIVVVGSVVGRHISPFSAAYSATKSAVHVLTEALRRELSPHGIRVSLVEPGIVLSGFQEGAKYQPEMVQGMVQRIGPLPDSSDLANAVHYVVSQPAHVHISNITVRPTRQDYP